MNNDQFIKFIPNEEGLLALGAQLAPLCGDSAIIFLYGNLGAGKTTFTRGFLRGLGYKGKVKSPTYTLVEPYEINNQIIYHFDFYRLQGAAELEFIGIQDYFSPKTISLIEWPDQGLGMLPSADLSCHIETEQQGRKIRIEANSMRGQYIVTTLLAGGYAK